MAAVVVAILTSQNKLVWVHAALCLRARLPLLQIGSEVTARLKEATQDFKAQLPIILELGNPAMRPRHWQKLFKAMNQPYYPDLVFSLSELLDHGVAQHAELIGELSAAASGEEQLKESLVGISKARHSYSYDTGRCGDDSLMFWPRLYI